MADIICRWRNGTPKTIVELVNSMPHEKMDSKRFRNIMSTRWKGEFFTSPYQLACQLGLYCEAEDGFFYPRFDHDINENEAKDYLKHWLPRYYVPNPYVGKDGFNNIACPTYVLKELYMYASEHPNCKYSDAYKAIFKETPKNNNDIVKNYINNYTSILKIDKNEELKVIETNPSNTFNFMERNDKKSFFENFNFLKKDPMTIYLEGDTEQRKELFTRYLTLNKFKPKTIKDYVNYHLTTASVLQVIKDVTQMENLYKVVSLVDLNEIRKKCSELEENKTRNNIYTASISNYIKFINYLETEDAIELFNEPFRTLDHIEMDENETKDTEIGDLPSIPFSIKTIISLIKETGLLYTDNLIKRFAFSLLSKRFLILSGLAGSGKTQLALAFAHALAANQAKQVCVVSVGADWTNREPLLGFPNALQPNQYIRPESGVLDLLIEANKEENQNKPFFLILDEMNMSYVERYFADFLSSMESHEKMVLWNGCKTYTNEEPNDDTPSSIGLPKNLFIVGTINVDETTYMFSPKVLDRANVIEFKISANEMLEFLTEMKEIDRACINGKAAGMGSKFVELATDKQLADNNEAKKCLQNFFKELKEVNAEFGYRSATEIFRFISQAKSNDDTEQALTDKEILDAAIVQKLLPKLHGSRKKLEPVLNKLWRLCFDEDKRDQMPILYENITKANFQESADKIFRMYKSANDNGFTSFAEA